MRYQGQSGTGTEIAVPAYTGIDYQTGKATLYKKAIKIINAWVPDTGASFMLLTCAPRSPTATPPDGGHITINTIPLTLFNANAPAMLKNAEGDYIYDAVDYRRGHQR